VHLPKHSIHTSLNWTQSAGLKYENTDYKLPHLSHNMCNSCYGLLDFDTV